MSTPVIPSTTPASVVQDAPTPVITTPVHTDTTALVRANFRSAPADTQPCNWQLTSVPGTECDITAINTVSGSTFEGTIAEFNQALKGL